MTKFTGWRPPLRLLFLALALSVTQFPAAQTRQEVVVKIGLDHRFGHRYGTGSGSDLVSRKVYISVAPGRYRSLYRTDGRNDDQGLKIDTELVNLNVVVTDKSGQRVRVLVKDDFEVFEDGARQEISHFVTEERPLKLVLLFDVSISMEEILPTVKQTAIRFVEGLSDADRLSVVSFASEVRLHANWAEKGKSIEAIKTIAPESHPQPVPPTPDRPGYNIGDNNTFLYEGFQYVFDMLRDNRDRVAVIMFSDGVDTGAGRSAVNIRNRVEELGQETKRQAEESWALVYPIRFKTKQVIGHFPEPAARRIPSIIRVRIGGPPKIPGSELFSEITAASGGSVFEFTGEGDLAQAVREVIADLRSQYGIAYTPPDTSPRKGFHRIKVRVKKPGSIARTRNGYLAPK